MTNSEKKAAILAAYDAYQDATQAEATARAALAEHDAKRAQLVDAFGNAGNNLDIAEGNLLGLLGVDRNPSIANLVAQIGVTQHIGDYSDFTRQVQAGKAGLSLIACTQAHMQQAALADMQRQASANQDIYARQASADQADMQRQRPAPAWLKAELTAQQAAVAQQNMGGANA